MNKIVKLSSICDIRFGFYGQIDQSGTIPYLQARQFSDDGRLVSHVDEFILDEGKIESHFLKKGDVLFVGKGNRLFSWHNNLHDYHLVASSIFFVLRPKQNLILPEYLSAILNAPQSKSALLQIGGGTNIFSIRKSELGAFEIPLPPMQQQKLMAALAALHQQEIELSQKLITEKQNLYTAIISKLVK